MNLVVSRFFCLGIYFYLQIFLFQNISYAQTLQKNSSSGLSYLFHKSNSTTNTKLLFLLHGYRSNESDLYSFASSLPKNFHLVSVRAPIDLDNNAYAWYDFNFQSKDKKVNINQLEKSRKQLIVLINEIAKQLNIKPKDIYIGGFSQGGIMAYDLLLTNPDILHGVCIFSGRLLDESKQSAKPNISAKRVFISHGTKDSILNIEEARSAVKYLKIKGAKPDYHEYPDVHTINKEMYSEFLKWLGV